jgi:hypothetical protein
LPLAQFDAGLSLGTHSAPVPGDISIQAENGLGGFVVLPETLECEDCGRAARVRGYGRIEYGWPKDGQFPASSDRLAMLDLIMVRLTIDCPRCGVRVQDYYPGGSSRPTNRPLLPEALRRLGRRGQVAG